MILISIHRPARVLGTGLLLLSCLRPQAAAFPGQDWEVYL